MGKDARIFWYAAIPLTCRQHAHDVTRCTYLPFLASLVQLFQTLHSGCGRSETRRILQCSGIWRPRVAGSRNVRITQQPDSPYITNMLCTIDHGPSLAGAWKLQWREHCASAVIRQSTCFINGRAAALGDRRCVAMNTAVTTLT